MPIHGSSRILSRRGTGGMKEPIVSLMTRMLQNMQCPLEKSDPSGMLCYAAAAEHRADNASNLCQYGVALAKVTLRRLSQLSLFGNPYCLSHLESW